MEYNNPSQLGPENPNHPQANHGTGVFGPLGQSRGEYRNETLDGSRMPGIKDDGTYKRPTENPYQKDNPGGANAQTTDFFTGQSNILSAEKVPGFVPEQNQPGNTFAEGQVGPSNFVYQFDDGTVKVVPSNWDPVHNQVGGHNTNQYYADGSESYVVNTNTPGYFGATKNIIKAMPTSAGPSIAGELGTGNLVFSTLYNHDHTAKFDSRLRIQTPAGYRGTEPYIVHNIPVGTGVPGEYGGLEGGRATNKTVLGRLVPAMRAVTDAMRIGKFIFTGQGLQFELTQFALQFMNPRNQKIYNPLSMISSIPIGVAAKLRLARGAWLNPKTLKYPQTLLDTSEDYGNSGAGSAAREWKDSAVKMANKFGLRFGTYFVGGNAMQVKGDNVKEGSTGAGNTDILTVAPAPANPMIPGAFMSFFSPEYNAKQFSLKQLNVQSTFARDDGTGTAIPLHPRNLPYKSAGLAKLKRKSRAGSENDPKGMGTLQADLNKDLEMEQLEFGKYEDIPDPQSAGGGSLAGIGGDMATKYKEQNEAMNVNESLNVRYRNKMSAEGVGDSMSLIEINKPKEGDIKLEDVHPKDAEKIESSEHGMPFYFKDLRTNQYLFFRAFIEGINEAVTPTWTEEKYIGRSEPVHIYKTDSKKNTKK